MAHDLQERYSQLVLAKVRDTLVLKDGIVFNNDYEGDPKSGAVKIPVRDTEVAVSDYDKAQGIAPTNGATSYLTVAIDKDKAVNEIIDGYEAESVPDGLVADRLDSAAYGLANAIDNEGASVLLAGSTAFNVTTVTSQNAYDVLVDLRTTMSKAKIPNDGARYLLVTPEFYALLLKDKDHFVGTDGIGAEIVATGAVGRIAGFTVYEWNDDTANLLCIAGHPRFATRVNEWQVPVHLQDLSGSGKYIGACAVQGRNVFAHKVLRSAAIRAMYAPGTFTLTAAQGASAGGTILTASGATGTLKYTKNPAKRAAFGEAYTGSSLTSGSTEISGCQAGDVIEVVALASSKVNSVAYIALEASDIK